MNNERIIVNSAFEYNEEKGKGYESRLAGNGNPFPYLSKSREEVSTDRWLYRSSDHIIRDNSLYHTQPRSVIVRFSSAILLIPTKTITFSVQLQMCGSLRKFS